METQQDSADHPFIDVPTLFEEHVRVTFISADQAGYGADSVRIQIRDGKGHLRQGPEVPLTCVGGLIQAIVELVRKD